ncbi:MAG TPA: YeeE/YedE family protein [Hyphomicrobiaceae bacterium]|nr:YeeE/YedE family protein [Hyphomicrobiaceae bacterium]
MPATEFTPWQSLFGGALIGTASVLLMLLHGRIAGLTGIVSGLIPPIAMNDWQWRLALLVGMVSAPATYWLVAGRSPAFHATASVITLVIGGLITGIGVHFSSGCTSGHGVCGLARFSRRSLVAVATFMASTAVTVFVVRHLIGP